MEIDDQRTRLLRDAVYEMDKLARMLPDMVPLDEEQAHYAVRGIAGRILRLTHVLMGGLGANEIADDEIKGILHFDGFSQG